MASSTLYDEVLALEEQTWRALQRSGTALIPFLTADIIMQFPLGLKVTPRSKPSVADILHSEAFVPWKEFALKDIDVTPVGSDGAVISYHATATRPALRPEDAEGVAFEALCSSTWRFEEGKWLMCFHQQTLTS